MNRIKSCNINKLLKEGKKTKVWLANKCNISPQHLGEIANGKRKGITLTIAARIANALKQPIVDVFTME